MHGQADLDGIGIAAGCSGAEAHRRRALRDCARGPLEECRAVGLDGRVAPPAVVEGHAVGLDRDRHRACEVCAVPHERAQRHLVADAEEARQRGAHDQRLGDQQLARARARQRVGGHRLRRGAPRGGVVRQVQVEGRCAVLVGRELADPEGGALEVRAGARRRRHLAWVATRECGYRGQSVVRSFSHHPKAATCAVRAFAWLARGRLAERFVVAVARDGLRGGRPDPEVALVPERVDGVARVLRGQCEYTLVHDGDGHVRRDAPPLGVRHSDLVLHRLAWGCAVAVRLNADIEHAGRCRDGELDVADRVARVRVVVGGPAVEHDTDEDVGDVRVLDRDGEQLAVRLERAHFAAHYEPALDGDERGGAGEGCWHQHARDIADLVLLAVSEEFDDVVVAARPRHEVAAAHPDEARRARDAARFVRRLGDEAVGPRRGR